MGETMTGHRLGSLWVPAATVFGVFLRGDYACSKSESMASNVVNYCRHLFSKKRYFFLRGTMKLMNKEKAIAIHAVG